MPITYQKLSSNTGGVSIDLIFPIGSVITNSSPTFDPNKLYEGTTWQRIKGRVIVGVDENDTSFNTINKTGGHKELQSHTHSGSTNTTGGHTHSGSSSTSGSHNHKIDYLPTTSEAYGYGLPETRLGAAYTSAFRDRVAIYSNDDYDTTTSSGSHNHDMSLNSAGSHSHSVTIRSSGSGNGGNLPPYITKYVWERTA